MPNLSVESITIDDFIEQLATTCHLDLVNSTQIAGFPAEFSLPGDSTTLVSSDLRPTGDRVSVNIAYGATPMHTAFSGTIEHLDDQTDADKYVYGIDLSNLPQGYPQRNMISNIYNQVTLLNGYTDVTAYAILEDICARSGLALGRIDMPDYNVWGNFEVIRQNPVEVAKMLCEPFNKFDFFKYLVRCDSNGLQIIGIDYTQGAQVSNVHTITKIKSSKRSYDIYNPEQRIGASDVLISGGDVYGNNGAYTATGYCSKVFTDSSSDVTLWGQSPDNPSTTPPTGSLTNWTETDTTIIFLVDMTINSPSDPRIVSGIVVSDSLDTNIALLQSGGCDDIKVRETYVMKQVVRNFDSVIGLVSENTTIYSYDMYTFNSGIYETGNLQPYQCVEGIPGYLTSKIVVSYSEVTDVVYANGVAFPTTLTKTWFKYNPTGVLQFKTISTYYNTRGQWVLQGVKDDPGSTQEAASSLIQFYDNIRNIAQPDALHGAKTDIGKYQLRNGVQVLPVQLQRDPCPLSEGGTRLKDFVLNNAFQMSGPYMDYNGLWLLWQLAQREIQLEQQGAYWDNVTVTTTIDTSAIVGESIIIKGAGGIVDKTSTTITDNEAITTVKVRRIIVPNNGTLQVPISLAGTYPKAVWPQTDFPSGVPQSINYPLIQTYSGTSPLAWAG